MAQKWQEVRIATAKTVLLSIFGPVFPISGRGPFPISQPNFSVFGFRPVFNSIPDRLARTSWPSTLASLLTKTLPASTHPSPPSLLQHIPFFRRSSIRGSKVWVLEGHPPLAFNTRFTRTWRAGCRRLGSIPLDQSPLRAFTLRELRGGGFKTTSVSCWMTAGAAKAQLSCCHFPALCCNLDMNFESANRASVIVL